MIDIQCGRMKRTEIENFRVEDFELPLEELSDGRLSHYELKLIKKQQDRINNADRILTNLKKAIASLESSQCSNVLKSESENNAKMMKCGESTNVGMKGRSSIASKRERLIKDSYKELDLIRKVVGKDYNKIKKMSTSTLADFEDESTIEFPRLGSMEEKVEDLRQEDIEKFYERRGMKVAARFTNKDKRMLRRWFQELDYDGSGEVSVVELQDPMLSAGIFKTREQIFRVMLNADKNETLGLDFEEFLNALYDSKNHLIDVSKLSKLQSMGNDPNGMAMETLITAERRKKIMNSIVNQMEKRMDQFSNLHQKVSSTGIKMERLRGKMILKEREEREKADRERESSRQSQRTSVKSELNNTTRSDKIIPSIRRRKESTLNPLENLQKEYTKANRKMKLLHAQHDIDRDLHDQYLNSLEVVLQQKRQFENGAIEKEVEEWKTSQEGGIAHAEKEALKPKNNSNAFRAYARHRSKSMFGNSRRICQLSVQQNDGTDFLAYQDLFNSNV